LERKALGLKFKTSNQIAAEIIQEIPAELAELFDIRVLFDSGFLNELVVGACQERGFHFISVAKSNRVFFPHGYSGKRKISSYGPGVLRTYGKTIQVESARGKAKFRVAVRDGWMKGLGSVRVVFSQRLSDGSFVALVTDDLASTVINDNQKCTTGKNSCRQSSTARDVVIGYKARWTIEVTLKNLKQSLGLGQYQTTRYKGLIHHLYLCLISYQVLITLGLQCPAEKLPSGAAIESIPRIQDRLRVVVANDHMARLSRGKNPTRVLSGLRKLLVSA
jgi:hypothetical protein